MPSTLAEVLSPKDGGIAALGMRIVIDDAGVRSNQQPAFSYAKN